MKLPHRRKFLNLIAQWLSERFGQSFVVENRTGAATNIAAEAVVRASADGYTLLFVTTTNAINTTLYEKLSFNLGRDIVLVAEARRTRPAASCGSRRAGQLMRLSSDRRR